MFGGDVDEEILCRLTVLQPPKDNEDDVARFKKLLFGGGAAPRDWKEIGRCHEFGIGTPVSFIQAGVCYDIASQHRPNEASKRAWRKHDKLRRTRPLIEGLKKFTTNSSAYRSERSHVHTPIVRHPNDFYPRMDRIRDRGLDAFTILQPSASMAGRTQSSGTMITRMPTFIKETMNPLIIGGGQQLDNILGDSGQHIQRRLLREWDFARLVILEYQPLLLTDAERVEAIRIFLERQRKNTLFRAAYMQDPLFAASVMREKLKRRRRYLQSLQDHCSLGEFIVTGWILSYDFVKLHRRLAKIACRWLHEPPARPSTMTGRKRKRSVVKLLQLKETNH